MCRDSCVAVGFRFEFDDCGFLFWFFGFVSGGDCKAETESAIGNGGKVFHGCSH